MRKTCLVMAEGQQTLLKSIKNLLEPHVRAMRPAVASRRTSCSIQFSLHIGMARSLGAII